MALPITKDASKQFAGLNSLPVLRQLGLMIGLAASVAVGVAVVMWSQTPNYSLLYSGLSEKDTGLVVDALDKIKVDYQLGATGTILVPGDKVHDLRLKLAAEGLPKGSAVGFESLDETQGFGVSQFMETARYHRALEVELSRSIGTLDNVQSARVHLAIPKQSVFLRNKRQPSASILVNLYSGRSLEQEQVAAITHLVSSSVPNLDVEDVTVVDQRGRLLTSKEHAGEMALSAAQFDYNRRMEKAFRERIEGILAPIVGADAVRAEVTVDTDFTTTEKTQEAYNPDTPALRSSQLVEEQSTGAASGVPGALSNQPPGNATVPETTANTQATQNEQQQTPSGMRRRSVQNYELDRTISHTRLGAGRLKRLSVAVVIDDKMSVGAKGEAVRASYSPEELERFTGLVKKAVGFSAQRGDSVNVINEAFSVPLQAEPLPEPAMWKQSWFQDLTKKLLGALVVLVLLFGVLRPVLRSLAQQGKSASKQLVRVGDDSDEDQIQEDTLKLTDQKTPKLAAPVESDSMLVAKSVVESDPKLAAQVVKSWLSTE